VFWRTAGEKDLGLVWRAGGRGGSARKLLYILLLRKESIKKNSEELKTGRQV
jgi:hypothetical protein